uniref:DNA-directed RNA polymerase III subunit RPC3 n=1 Tax=Caenorhabditis tropicalis TaxID=1561998 RepID=A0A1I7UQN5_9PELO
MESCPGTSESGRRIGRRRAPFERKSLKDLVSVIPECEGSRMINNMNDVFEVLDDKIRMMNRVMVNLACDDYNSKVFTRAEILQRMVVDCQGITSLMQIQKMKLSTLRHVVPVGVVSNEFARENALLRQLNAKKFQRKLPSSPYMSLEPEAKVQKGNFSDVLIENVYRSVYRDFLLFPSPVFRVSDFVRRMCSSNSNKFHGAQIAYLLPELVRRKVIHRFPLTNEADSLIVKELHIPTVGPHLKIFSLTELEYMQASVPKKLSELKQIISKIDQSVLAQLDGQIWASLANIIMATVIKSPSNIVGHDEFPECLPKSIMSATATLSRVGFLEQNHQPNQSVMKFEKKINKESIEQLGKLFGNYNLFLINY